MSDIGRTFIRMYKRMPWFFQYISLLLPLAMSMVDVVDSGNRLPFYWNASNPIFRPENQKLRVNLGDRVNIICPNYKSYTHESEMEYYSIYMVSKTEYEECVIYDPKNAIRLLRCLKSNDTTLFTLHVREFQPFPFVPDFEAGKSYYIVTTSEGTYSGLDNQWGGACKHKGMRLKLDICCSSTTASPGGKSHTKSSRRHTTVTPVSYPKQTTSTLRRVKMTTTPIISTTTTTTKLPISTTTVYRKTIHSYDTKIIEADFDKQSPGITKQNSEINATGPKNMGLINSSGFPRCSWTLLFALIHVCQWVLLSR
ncbi:ephrin-B2 [Octopus bimaculoides]|uniref:ephrin-B2 n=1 Tax=Octopus bimaculoides TaxID=37653 RepID=UPI0022E83A22|nr:ephrin-B2 [Octopus bimaculoides]